MKAKELGLIRAIKPILEEMKDAGFYISKDVMEMVLRNMHEL